MHKYVIMGGQGSGKGTQAALLAADLDLEHINVGDILRWNIQQSSTSTCPTALLRLGLDYNLIYHRPASEDICDVCGGQLVQRDDDSPEAVRARLRDYHEKTAPVLDLFRRKEVIVSVRGTGSAAAVRPTHRGGRCFRRDRWLCGTFNRLHRSGNGLVPTLRRR